MGILTEDDLPHEVRIADMSDEQFDEAVNWLHSPDCLGRYNYTECATGDEDTEQPMLFQFSHENDAFMFRMKF